MDNIKQKIKEVNDYFVNKIMNGEYIVETVNNYTVVINIEGYIFCLWAANSWSYFRTYSNETNFMALEFTEEQQQYLHPIFNKLVTDFIDFTEIEQYNNLKNKYENTL